ncbi:MobF family relaxase [Streptomyces sp. NPDC051993]|uniref:MobF family relaxase n=1 Tax=Streptomyces sp. NPDC051993 TaxID=3155286 RepID=UPI003435EEA8
MAWVTRIVDDEQVEYRLTQHSGCYVQQDGEGVAQVPQQGSDRPVDYRTDSADSSGLVWIGEGLPAVGLTPGTVLDESAKKAARALANGVDPRTGERLVRPELRAHPRARLVGAPLVEAIEKAAAAAGVEAAALFTGKPKQREKYLTLARMVHQKGERHRLQVDSLHRLARAAGVRLEDVYEPAELAAARAHENERVNVRVRAYDVVADLPKSTSVLWALLGPEREAEFRKLVHQAKAEAFGQLEEWIGYGLASEDGKLHRIATGGLLGWSVEHQSARPVDADVLGDPHLHLHLVIANLARCEDGEWRAIANGGMDLHRHAKAFDALFKARVRALAAEQFGVRYEQDRHTGAWEIVGILERLRTHFSRRAAAVDEEAGADASRDEKLRVSAATRHAKHDTGSLDLRADWRSQAEDLGIDVDAMVAAAAPGPGGPDGTLARTGPGLPLVSPPEQIAAEVFDPQRGLTAHEKEFSKAQLLAAVTNACPYGLAADELEQLADRVLTVKGYAKALPPRGPGLLSNAGRFTTQDILAAEQIIVDQARARFADGSARLSEAQAATALSVFEVASGFTLGGEQRHAVQRLLTAGHGIDAVEGVAGAGKTSLMAACRIGWDAVGMTYAGTALSAVAAANLQEGSGIPARTLASWLERIASGQGLRGLDVLVIDEAVMTDDRSLAILLKEAARTGTKVIGVGDPQQLQAIGPGGGWSEVHRIVGGARLTVNRRQQDATERAALEAWRTGPEGRERALQQLANGERVHATDTPDQARAGILEAWNARRTGWADPHDVLDGLVVLAARNSDVAALNHGAQAIRRANGELGAAHTYALPRGGKLTLAVGDLVRVRANDYRSRRGEGPDVLNGYRAVITAMSDDHRVQITWRRTSADGRHSFHQAWVTPGQVSQGALSLGYAMTVSASQGLTVDVSLLYGLGANAYSAYPGITRARQENHLWLPVAALEDERTRLQLGEPASEAEALERALNAYAALLRQDRPSGMVLDQLRTALEPMAPTEAAAAEDQFAAWDDRTARPYGALPVSRLEETARQAERQAAEAERAAAEQARTAHEGAAALTARPTPGQQITAGAEALLGQADQLAALAEQEFARAAQARTEAVKARQILATVQQTAGRGRLALRMAGTSKAEQEQLTAHYNGQLTAATETAQQAQSAAEEAQRQAARLVADSPYAALLRDLTGTADPAAGMAGLRRQYAAVRAQLPRIAERIDADQAAAVQQARTQSVQLGARASAARSTAEALRTEAQLRRQIAAQAPQQHAREAAARDAAVRTAATRPSAPSAPWPRPAAPAAVRGPGERLP